MSNRKSSFFFATNVMTVSLVWFIGRRLAFDLVICQLSDVTDATTEPDFYVDQSTASSQMRTLKNRPIALLPHGYKLSQIKQHT